MSVQQAIMERLRHVASRLGQLRDRAVFMGGSVVGLLITDPGAPDVRPTKDVDAAVLASSFADTTRLDEELGRLGFRHCMDPGAPACRWIVDDCVVDIMPIGLSANTYRDRWTPDAMEHAVSLQLQPSLTIRHVTAPYFVALKLAAFADRGNGDYQLSPDIEDIIQILDGRSELMVEMQAVEPRLLQYITSEFRGLLHDDDFLDAIPAHLPGDSASQARAPLLLARMAGIVALGSPQEPAGTQDGMQDKDRTG